MTAKHPLVCVRDLHVTFRTETGPIHAVNGVDLDLSERETLCILGESGSGKSVTIRSLMRLHPPKKTQVSGRISIAGQDVLAASEAAMNEIRGTLVAMVFQEPMTALDPLFTIGTQIAETIQKHEPVTRAEARARALELLDLVQIPSAKLRLNAYPHELSGGLRQRAMIAVALACRPKLLLADEPTTALDATVQIQVLLLLKTLQAELGMGLILITHDLGVAAEIADRLAVMYAGRFVEEGPVDAVIDNPLHPYVQGLIGATVGPHSRGKPLKAIPGAPPRLQSPPTACAFIPRCVYAHSACYTGVPDWRDAAPDQRARCVLLDAPERSGRGGVAHAMIGA
jgi:peptide/nickel transport system ATP-binding protein